MARGDRKRAAKFPPQVNGPPFEMGPGPPPPDGGWGGPPFPPDGFHGGPPGPHPHFMEGPMMGHPMPGYDGPMNGRGFGYDHPGFGPPGPHGNFDPMGHGPMQPPGYGSDYGPMGSGYPPPMGSGYPPPIGSGYPSPIGSVYPPLMDSGYPPALAYPPPMAPPWQSEANPYPYPPPNQDVSLNITPEQPAWREASGRVGVATRITSLIMGASQTAPAQSEITDLIGAPKVPDKPKTSQSKSLKTSSTKKLKQLGLLGKRHFDKPPPGRSTGIISFIGTNYGFIEREDLKKFTFSFEVFFGNPKSMKAGVRVHFTACKEMSSEIATDVKVPPGGTENIDPEIHEGLVSKVITDPVLGEKMKPGQVEANINGQRTELIFEKRDCTITLMPGDHVLLNLLTDIVTTNRRATNIMPKTPETFKITGEKREKGVVMSVKDGSGSIMAVSHDNLPFDTTENMSETELSVMDEVEFTVTTVKGKERAVRLKKVEEGSVVFAPENQSLLEEVKKEDSTAGKDKWKPVTSEVPVIPEVLQKILVSEDISYEKYEGTVLKAILKVPHKKQVQSQEPEQGRLVMTVAGVQKQQTFGAVDILTEATMLDGDKVTFNISTHNETKAERAVNVEILPDTFEESTEQRRTGVVVDVGVLSGFIKCQQNPQLFFRLCEVMEEKKLDLSEKVEFSVIPHETAEGGNQAIRIKRLTKTVFTPVPKLGAHGPGNKEKKKMTIKLLRDPKDKAENKDGGPVKDNPKPSAESDKLKAVVKTLRSGLDNKVSTGYDSNRRRYGRSRTRSRSPSRDRFGRVILRRPRSTSRERRQERGSGHSRSRRSSSRERSYRRSRSRSRSRERPRRGSKKRSSSREREGSSQRRKESKPGANTGMVPPDVHMHDDVVDEELARKKRELEQLNELIARKRAIAAMEPKVAEVKREVEKTCFDYDHGRIALADLKPTTDYKTVPVKSILKKRTDGITGLLFPIKVESTETEQCRYNPPTLHHIQSFDTPDIQTPYKSPSAQPSGQRSYYELPYQQSFVHHSSQLDQLSPAGQTPVDLHSPYPPSPSQKMLPEDRSNLSTQLNRFLNILNKGVDAGLLSTVVNEARDEMAVIKEKTPESPQFYHESHTGEDHYRELYRAKEVEPTCRDFVRESVKTTDIYEDYRNDYNQDDLLPHERAVQDGSGFSQIFGLTGDGQHCHREFQRETSVDEEEQFLYGEKTSTTEKEHFDSSALADRYRRDGEDKRSSPVQTSVEGTREDSENKREHFDKIQSLLRTIGLNLNTAEVTKLADRTRERLYGKKNEKSPSEYSDRERGQSSRRVDRQRSRTHSSDSERHQSISPVKCSQREVHVSHQEVSEYEGFLDREEEEALERAREMQSLTRTVRNTPMQTSPTTPTTTYSQELPGTSYPSTQYAMSGWPQGASSQYPVPSSSAIPSLGRQALGVYPPAGYPPYALPMGHPPGMPPTPHVPLTSPYYGQSSGGIPSTSPYSLHPLTGAPIVQSTQSQVPQQVSNLTQVKLSNPASDALNTGTSRCLKVIETTEAVKKAAPKHAKVVQFNLPNSEAAQPQASSNSSKNQQASTGAEDDIKAKQKKRLEQFNQRMRDKNEQRMKDFRSRDKKNTPGKVISGEPKNIWICGHSLIYWAEMRAKSPEVGMQLGMDPSSVVVWWKGTQGMTWAQLLPQLLQLKVKWPNPDVVVMHLGGNDLSTDSPESLLASVKKDLSSMRSIFPQCLLVWSDILPRRSWRHSDDMAAVDQFRAAINRRVHSIIAELGGTALTHDNIKCGTDAGLYRPDGVHLSGKGIDTFNLNLQDFLEKWETEANKAPEQG